eukprot:5323543-Pyramimonas_sp.AAC.1
MSAAVTSGGRGRDLLPRGCCGILRFVFTVAQGGVDVGQHCSQDVPWHCAQSIVSMLLHIALSPYACGVVVVNPLA